jgi:DNA-binding response OmpR family regulator
MSTARRVVLIEDDEGIREVVDLALATAGHEVHLALNGADALTLVERVSPDVILLDLKMPVIDGREFARQYRERGDGRAPLVLLTAAQDAAGAAASIGADGYLEKPFDVEALLAIVEEMTSRV